LSDAYHAELMVDWSEVHNSQAFKAGGSAFFIGADVEKSFDQLFRDNAIRLTTIGSDAVMEGLLNTVYVRLLELLFNPVPPERVPDSQKGGLWDALSAVKDVAKSAASDRKTLGFGLNVGYQLKEMHTEGKSKMSFNGRSMIDRHHYITFNMGNLYGTYGNNDRFFKVAYMDDPAFAKRVVHVGVDGKLLTEFDKMVNSVTVTLKKEHQNGDVTMKELVVNRKTYLDSTGQFQLYYGNHKDLENNKWLMYQYQTQWHFIGGGYFTSGWNEGSAAMIDLFVPYERRTIEIMGEGELLKSQGVRAVEIQIYYPFFGELRQEKAVLRPNEAILNRTFEITVPAGTYEYDYKITWHLQGGSRKMKEGKDSTGLLFIDEIPNSGQN